MSRAVARSLTILVALVIGAFAMGHPLLQAEGPNDDRYFNQEKFDKHLRDGQVAEVLGYILGGAGIVLIIAYIPVAIYQDRKKKARKRAAQQAADETS